MVSVIVGLTIGLLEMRQVRAAQPSEMLLALYQTLQDPERIRGRDILRNTPDTLSVASLDTLNRERAKSLNYRTVLCVFLTL